MAKKTSKPATKTASSISQEIREDITKQMVASLKEGKIPWRKMWSADKNCGLPRNIESKKLYRGINPLILTMSGLSRGFFAQWWGTYKQWTAKGVNVRKGEKASRVVFYRIIDKTNDTPASDTISDVTGKKNRSGKIFFLTTYAVFNIQQTEDPEGKLAEFMPSQKEQEAALPADWEEAERVVTATKADIRIGGNQPCYAVPVGAFPNHSEGDFILSPPRSNFVDLKEYYFTMYHELAHGPDLDVNA